MQFSIRDLLWLMAIVALAATLFADRQLMKRKEAKWATVKAKLEQDADAAAVAAKMRIDTLRHENALLGHQVVVQMEKQKELERQIEVAAQRRTSSPALTRFRPPPSPSPVLVQPVDAER